MSAVESGTQGKMIWGFKKCIGTLQKMLYIFLFLFAQMAGTHWRVCLTSQWYTVLCLGSQRGIGNSPALKLPSQGEESLHSNHTWGQCHGLWCCGRGRGAWLGLSGGCKEHLLLVGGLCMSFWGWQKEYGWRHGLAVWPGVYYLHHWGSTENFSENIHVTPPFRAQSMCSRIVLFHCPWSLSLFFRSNLFFDLSSISWVQKC